MMEFLKKIKRAFASEQIKVKNKQLILICLFTPLLYLLLIFLMTESYNDLSNMLQEQTVLSNLFFVNFGLYVQLFHPIFLLLICYIIFSQVENKRGNNILHNSVLPSYFIDYSKILMVIKYNAYNMLFLIGYLLLFIIFFYFKFDLDLNIDYQQLPKLLLIILFSPILTLPIIVLLNILNKWISGFYISFLLILPLIYFSLYNAIMVIKVTIYSYFNIQLVLFRTIESEIPISSMELFLIVSSNILFVALSLYFIKRYSYKRVF